MQVWMARRDALDKYAAKGAEAARRAGALRRSVENSVKRLVGQQEGLMNPRIMARKAGEEKELRAAVAAKPDLFREYGAAWDHVALANKELRTMAPRLAFSTLSASRLASIASTLVRYADEVRKPNDTRYDEFRDSRLESLKFNLLSPAPIYADMDEALLASWLEAARKTLGAQDPFVSAALGSATPATAAQQAISATKLADVAVRKALLDGGADAIAKSDDPMIALARRVEPIIRELRAWNEQHVVNVEAAAGQKIASARFGAYGKTISPDANFSLRLSFGRVLGYEEGTTLVPARTTLYGLYDRAASFGEQPPFDLPDRWRVGRSKLDLSTPVNFVYTADTIGGNSGSPVINRNAELVGLNFDSNIQKLANRYLYIDESEGSRAIGVHSAVIVEALTKLYGAEALVREILGK
jgi:hypothetical protein